MKKMISFLIIAGVMCSLCSCTNNSKKNLSDDHEKKYQNYDNIVYNENQKDIGLKAVDESQTYFNFKQGCMFKDEFYTLAQSKIDETKTFFTDYIILDGKIAKSNDIHGSYDYIYDVYYLDSKYYTIESDKNNSYICKYDANTMNLEKTSVLFENNTNCENKSIYKYDFSDYMYISDSQNKIKFDSDLTVEHIENSSYLTDKNNNNYFIDYNKENSVLKLSKYNKDNIIYECTDFEDLSAICTGNTFEAFIQNNKLYIACQYKNNGSSSLYINQVNLDTGKTEERYEIENAEYIKNGTEKYVFTYSYNSSIYGFDSSTGSSDLLFLGDNYFDSIDNWQYENNQINIKKRNVDLSEAYGLLKVNDSGGVSKLLNLQIPMNPIINQYILNVNDNNLYFSKLQFSSENKICGISIECSNDGEDFQILSDISFDNTIDNINAFYVDKNENIFILCFSEEKDKYIIYKYNINGEKMKENTLNFKDFYSVKTYNDSLYIMYYNDGSRYSKIDKDSLELVNQTDILNNSFIFFSNNADNCNWSYYDSNYNSIYSLSLENENIVEEIELNNYNIYSATGFSYFANGSFILQTEDKLYISNINQNSDIQTISIAGTETDQTLSEMINNFNSENNGYRIVFTDYNKYSGGEENSYFSGYDKLDQEILSNNIPDIIITDSTFNMQKYSDKNLFTDLYTLIKNDPEINETDYFTNIFNTFKNDDKLFQIPFCLNITTLIGTDYTSKCDDYMDYKEFIDFINTNPNSIYLCNNDYLPEFFLSSYINEFVDIKNSKCDFRNETFYDTIKMLKANFKSQNELDKDCSSPDEYIMYPETDIVNNVCSSIDYKEHFFFGTPSFTDAGYFINNFNGFAITEKCPNKDIAWNFIKKLLFDDYQNKIAENIPVKKSSLENNIMRLTYCNLQNISFTELMSQNPQIENMVSFFEKTFVLNQSNSEIYKLINNELQTFYNESKTAEETSENIQNLITRYLYE